ncbi:Rhamnogalacturonate lyase [Sesbania bispinosa]|nr:Rhamnogalacturonate lyase [Sesbania bispinosa]
MRNGVFFRMAVLLLCFSLASSSENTSSFSSSPLRRGLREANCPESTPNHSPVKLNTENPNQVVIYNGIVSINLSSPVGDVIGISHSGIENVFDPRADINDRGYLDVVWTEPGKPGAFQRIHGTNFSVITANENIVEVSFLSTWTLGSSVPPINIDKRYILRRGDSGFYSYVIFDRPEGFPAMTVYQIRIVFKLSDKRFHYMAISDTRQRSMPTAIDRKTGKVLAYPEAVLLTHPSNSKFRGEVDDKYQYSIENADNTVNGWITTGSKENVGFWIITPSNEFRNGGPIKQDLTSHVGPVALSMFASTHYAGKELSITFEEGEAYKKVFGPVFIYLNSASYKVNFRSLWSDAVQQLSKEVKSWPYDFPKSKDFLPSNQRGAVAGRLKVQERGESSIYVKNAYIGLALPGDAGSWQTESKGYQFWTRTDENGYFLIKNVVPGKYNLYAWVPGYIGDYKYNATFTITPGRSINMGSLVYSPPRNGPTLWEIGIPDRSAAEFYVPDPYPKLLNYLYKNNPRDKFRQYGLWERYTDLYPNNDLVYTIGVDNYEKDWFFAHVTRNIGNSTYQPTTWKIVFELENNTLKGNYTLQLALASAHYSEVQVWFNDPSGSSPHFTTKLIGGDNVIARHGIHGLHRLYSIDVGSDLLVEGNNTLYLRQSRAPGPFQGVMYDYIRLESPPTPPT